MIKIENVNVYGFKSAIRGMRNPMNSWDNSDTISDYDKWRLGENDLKLMHTLAKAGSDHRKFLRMINVTCDITAPLYWWKEFDTYKVGTVTNSCSTMHKIAEKEFTIDDFSHEHLDGVSRNMFMQNDKDQPYFFCSFEDMLYIIVESLNCARNLYLQTKDKKYWWQMIQLLPSSYNQRRTVQMNYEVLRNMYYARKGHRLDEWHTFCDWASQLPYFREIILEGCV